MTALFLGAELGGQGGLVWTTPSWAIWLSVLMALVGLLLAARGRRNPWLRLVELLCWGLALGGLVVALAGPVWVEEEGRTEQGRAAVLIDASRSMSILQDGEARSAQIHRVVEHVRAQLGEVEVYHFGDELRVGEPGAFDMPGTDLGGALSALEERTAGEALSSVVVISDGLDRGLLRRRFNKEGPLAPVSAPGPLTVFQVGEVSDVVDLAVRRIDAGGYAFIRSPFRIRAELRGLGFEGRTLPVSLTRDGAVVQTRKVTLDEQGLASVVFEVVAEEAGRFSYAVSVPLYEGDAVPENNSMPVVVRVVRDRIRVLQVAGSPSWDVKFLRRFLKEDPSVQLVSFFILRTQRDVTGVYHEDELSLIQFPYERLFEQDLSTFDVVIFQNFDYAPFFRFRGETLLGNIASYVRGGGAFVMVGGDRSFALGDYGPTPIASILPVRIADTRGQPALERFRPVLTEAGARHPVSRLSANSAENRAWWARLHEMDGSNITLGPTKDAAVLLTHPSRTTASGDPMPVLAVREVGKGRTMALTTDASWRWSLSEAGDGRGNQAYLRFWKSAIRWLMRDTTVARVSAETARENYSVGEEVRVVVRARDAGFAQLGGAEVQLTVDNQGKIQTFSGHTSADGEVVIEVPTPEVGTYTVAAEVTLEGAPVGRASSVFAVTLRDPEVDEVAPDEPFLRWLATSGRYHGPGELGPVEVDEGAVRTVKERRESPLWRAPGLLALISLFAGLAWLVRRRGGLR